MKGSVSAHTKPRASADFAKLAALLRGSVTHHVGEWWAVWNEIAESSTTSGRTEGDRDN